MVESVDAKRGMHLTLPRSSRGPTAGFRMGSGLTPAVHTRVRVGCQGPVAHYGDPVLAGVEARPEVYVPISSPTSGRTLRWLRRAGTSFPPPVRCDSGGRRAGHVLQFGQRLDARVATAEEDEREGGGAYFGVASGGGDVELFGTRGTAARWLPRRLEPVAVLAQPGDREGAGEGSGANTSSVQGISTRAGALVCGGRGVDVSDARAVVDRDGLTDHETAARQHPAQRDDHMARGYGSGRRFGQEWLIRHIGLGIEHDDFDAAASTALPVLPLSDAFELMSELPLEAEGGGTCRRGRRRRQECERFPSSPSSHVHAAPAVECSSTGSKNLCDWRKLCLRFSRMASRL
jgi:hypothetical protein